MDRNNLFQFLFQFDRIQEAEVKSRLQSLGIRYSHQLHHIRSQFLIFVFGTARCVYVERPAVRPLDFDYPHPVPKVCWS